MPLALRNRLETLDALAQRLTPDTKSWVYGAKGALLFLSAMACCIYAEYLLGLKIMVSQGFGDLAVDSVIFYLPHYLNLSNDLWAGDFSFWSFQVGLGSNVYLPRTRLNPFSLLLLLSGPERIPYMLCLVAVAKHITAGMLFWWYLRLLELEPRVRLIGSLLYAFCGYAVLQGQWYHFLDYLVFYASVLVALEAWHQGGSWVWLVLVVGLLWLKPLIVVYQLAIFLPVYATFRYLLAYRFEAKRFILFQAKVVSLLALGFLVNSFRLLPALLWYSNTDRGTKAYSNLAIDKIVTGFSLPSILELSSIVHRFLSLDLLGSMNSYTGYLNSLEAPNAYIGLLALITIPQVFRSGAGKKRRWAGVLAVGFALVYFMMPHVRVLLNASVRVTFKYSILPVVLLLLVVAMIGLDYCLDNKEKKRTVLEATIFPLGLFPFISLGLSVIVGAKTWGQPSLPIAVLVTVFVFCYGGILWLRAPLTHSARRNSLCLLLLCVVIVELVVFARITLHTNRRLLARDAVAKKQSYFDNTGAALAEIRRRDPGFFRLEKRYYSASLNDPLAQGYFGTTGYQSFHEASNVAFFKGFGLPIRFKQKYLIGLANRGIMQSLLSVKYVLSKRRVRLPPIFEARGEVAGINIYENRMAMPIGFVYDEWTPLEEISGLSTKQRELLLTRAVILEQSPPQALPRLDLAAFISEVEEENNQRSPWFHTAFGTSLSRLAGNPLRITSFAEDRITGEVSLAAPGILFTSIPFSSGWRARVNGQETTVARGNLGFVTVPLEAGEHRVEFWFVPPGMEVGLALSAFGLLLTALLFWRSRKRRS